MNLLLLEKSQTIVDRRRTKHILEVLGAKVGDRVRAGVLDGPVGQAVLEDFHDGELRVRFEATGAPPPALPAQVFMALPRPKALRRMLVHLTTLGVKEIYLFNAFRVEKSYWHTEHLSEAAVRAALILGLEQARDTVLPRVHCERRLKPFAEDRLPSLIAGRAAFVAHPGAPDLRAASGPVSLAIGPEGGFIAYEVELLRAAGFETASLGPRILKCETAVSFALGRIFSSPL